ncbi:MAG: hybrid sensor histidine kinase/response regulator [Rickettsiales bacterium]
MKSLSRNTTNIWEYMIKTTMESEVFFRPFGWLLVIGYLGFYYFNLLVADPQGYENLSMRIIVAILGVGLIFKRSTMRFLQEYMAIYWYITLIFSLPFFFFYMLFHNPESNIWRINGLVGMVTLTFFVDWLGYIVLTIIGTTLSYVIFILFNSSQILPLSLLGVFGSYSAPIIYLVLFSYKRKQLYKEKLLEGEKEFNNKLLEQSVDLKKALSIKTEFLNNISHEVKTPISGVVNISELLVENWKKYSSKERFENVKLISQSGKRLLLLMNDILDLSKFESGKMSISFGQGNLESLVHEMVCECKELYLNKESRVKLETYIQPGLDSNLEMDSERIVQVLRNLLGNAIKFTPTGKVKIFLQKQGENLEVIFRDEGLGVPDDELESIFSSFVQSSRTKNKAGGTGLGLAICKEIIESHKGRIWAVNNHGGGSSFHFLLPKSNNNPQLNINKKAKGKVLVIDDDNTCHSILSLLLKAEGYEIVSVFGGVEGLDYLKDKKNKEEIDVILLDLMMPDMYGINVLKILKSEATTKNIPVIIHSASHDKNEHSKAISMGAESFIKKPYNRSELLIALNNAFTK